MRQIWPARHLQSPLSEVAAVERSAEIDATHTQSIVLLNKARDGRVAALEARKRGIGHSGDVRAMFQSSRS